MVIELISLLIQLEMKMQSVATLAPYKNTMVYIISYEANIYSFWHTNKVDEWFCMLWNNKHLSTFHKWKPLSNLRFTFSFTIKQTFIDSRILIK